MKNKKVQIGIIIIVVLTIAFFWSGNKEVIPIDSDIVYKDAGIIHIEEDIEFNEGTPHNENEGTAEEDEEIIDKAEDGDIKGQEIEDKDIENGNVEYKALKDEHKPIDKEEIFKEQKVEKEEIIIQDNKNKDKKDKYLTDPVPEGKPEPVEWQDTNIDREKELTATLSVTCKSILNNMDLFEEDKLEVLPEDGIIYATTTVTFYEGESVFDVLLREMQSNKIHMEFVMTPIYNSHYIEGINNIYEFDCGELSGWMYRVNSWFPNYGASRYMLEDGDKIEWIYTCDLGRDIGGDFVIIGGGAE